MNTSHLWWSSVGKKLLNGLSGLMLIGFVCVHLAGNLTLFARDGGKLFNSYAHHLEAPKCSGCVYAAGLLFATFLLLPLYFLYCARAGGGRVQHTVIVVRHRPQAAGARSSAGLAGGAAAASLGELGYNVLNFCFHDSPRRAHSVAAQGGINAAKNYQNDGDSVHRLFYDTVKGGDFRAREANVHRLAEVSSTSSTSASPRACPSPASTAACWPTAPSAAPRSPAPSTPAARPASSCCSAPTGA
jgi:hypothetical protein